MTEPNDADDRSELQAAGPSSLRRNGLPQELKDSWEPGPEYADTWGPYYSAQFPPTKVTPWINFKRMGSGVNVVRRHWDQREELRAAYEAEHGSDPDNWPHRHPGIVIDAVQFVAHAACLGCQWIDQPGNSMSDEGWRVAAAAVARRHEGSHREFRGQPDQ
jgi:hypothetical protein